MKDRVSIYPGRVTLTPVAGQENTYDMTRADQPTQTGDPLNKDTLLKDATAALFGLSETALPDEVLAKISENFTSFSELLNKKVSLKTGSYVGTGTYGQSNPNVLTFDFLPRFLIVIDPIWANGMLAVYGNTGRPLTIKESGNQIGQYVDEVTFNDSNKQVSWYTTYMRDGAADYQGNAQGKTYRYICFGIGG